MTYAPAELRTAGRPREPIGVLDRLRALAATLGRAMTIWVNRRAIFCLASLDDRHLDDIGISRSDVYWALSQPWHVDPSAALAERVAQRRGARRWASKFCGSEQTRRADLC